MTREERKHYSAIIAALGSFVTCAILLTGTTVYCVRYGQAKRNGELLMRQVLALEDDKDVLTGQIMRAESELNTAWTRIAELELEHTALENKTDDLQFAYDEVVDATGWDGSGTFRLTFYCPCEKCCGKYADGITATGTTAAEGRTIAVDPKVIPLGSEVRINGHTYIAEDTGVHGHTIDVFVSDHQEALRLGVQTADVAWRTEG